MSSSLFPNFIEKCLHTALSKFKVYDIMICNTCTISSRYLENKTVQQSQAKEERKFNHYFKILLGDSMLKYRRMFSLAIPFVLKFNDTTHLAKQLNYFACIYLIEAVTTKGKDRNNEDFILYPGWPVLLMSFPCIHLTE